MVKWSEFITSGSWNQTRSFDVDDDSIKNLWSGSVPMSLAGLQNLAPSTLGSISSGQGLDALKNVDHESVTVKVGPRLNEEYVNRIKKIRLLAMKFDPSMDAVKKVQEILTTYEETGILTQSEMKVLNRLYKEFEFEARYHPDKETTIGKINEILGGLNG